MASDPLSSSSWPLSFPVSFLPPSIYRSLSICLCACVRVCAFVRVQNEERGVRPDSAALKVAVKRAEEAGRGKLQEALAELESMRGREKTFKAEITRLRKNIAESVPRVNQKVSCARILR